MPLALCLSVPSHAGGEVTSVALHAPSGVVVSLDRVEGQCVLFAGTEQAVSARPASPDLEPPPIEGAWIGSDPPPTPSVVVSMKAADAEDWMPPATYAIAVPDPSLRSPEGDFRVLRFLADACPPSIATADTWTTMLRHSKRKDRVVLVRWLVEFAAPRSSALTRKQLLEGGKRCERSGEACVEWVDIALVEYR